MVIPNEGKLLWLQWALRSDGSDFEDFHLRLFTAGGPITDATTISDLTEATFPGYAAIAITRADWGAPAIVADVAVSSIVGSATFSCTAGAGETCNGWYLTSDLSDTVLAGADFDFPRLMNAGATELIGRELDLKSIT